MRAALDSVGLDPEHDKQLWSYLVEAAYSLVNSFGAGGEPADHPRTSLL
jgi:hemoglobin